MPSRPMKRLAVLIGTVLFLAACSSSPPPRQSSGSGRAPGYGGGASCVIGLNYQGVAFNRIPDSGKGSGCGITTAVSLIQAPTPLNRPVSVDCTLAQQLAQWDEQVVDKVAAEVFGKAIKTIHHYGGYVCRGRSSNSARLSEHAYGKAIDIGAFELEDGTIISVNRDWNAGGKKQAFLRKVAAGACPMFSVVLTPNSDSKHKDHFHLDVGPWKLCSL